MRESCADGWIPPSPPERHTPTGICAYCAGMQARFTLPTAVGAYMSGEAVCAICYSLVREQGLPSLLLGAPEGDPRP